MADFTKKPLEVQAWRSGTIKDIKTPQGTLRCDPGDWIVFGKNAPYQQLFVVKDHTFREIFVTQDPMGLAMMEAEIKDLPEIEIKGNPENAERYTSVMVTETPVKPQPENEEPPQEGDSPSKGSEVSSPVLTSENDTSGVSPVQPSSEESL